MSKLADTSGHDEPGPSNAGWHAGRSGFHCRLGWWSLLCFLGLGFALEMLVWLKIDWYAGAANETRRLMWRLAHAHGTLLGLIHLAFGLTLKTLKPAGQKACTLASRCLLCAGILLPGGFFLGGINVYGGDPGMGILLVPLGAGALFIAVLLAALASPGAGSASHPPGK